jgi:peroxiredoxin
METHIQEVTGEKRERRVPNFTLPAASGLDVTLYKFAGRKRPILFFPVSFNDASSKLFSRNLTAMREQLDEADAVFLPILEADKETVKAWAEENAKGASVLADTEGRVRQKFFEYFEVGAAEALLVLLTIYCEPIVIAHAPNAGELMTAVEMSKWMNMVMFACSE